MSLFPSLRLGLTLLLATFLAVSAHGQAPAIRILPMGDSITFGSGGTANRGGYRGTLYTLLTDAGYNVDYVGTQTGNSSAVPDQDHEGHGGWRIDQLDSNLPGWFEMIADPDVVLLHIGTNDFGQNFDIVNAIARLDALITKIATLRPYAHIIVTNLMERGEPQNTNIQTQFNPFVQDKVNAQVALGRRVTFLDMRAAVPLSDMPDNLHPNQTGYDKMAAAWLPAIQAVITPFGDAAAPAIVRARGGEDRTHVTITFSKPVADSAANVANYALSNGLTISAATLDAAKRAVTLTTSPQSIGTTYTVTVNGVTDRISPTPTALPANTTAQFFPPTPRGYLNNVPESVGYTLAYSLDVPNAANFLAGAVPYNVDNRNGIGPFTRVAYYVELQGANGDLQYLWTSMNAFTSDVNKIAVPTMASGATFQEGVTGMNVLSNVPGIVTGNGLAGHLEFWPTNYSAGNGQGIPGASDSTYDFGDTKSTGGNFGSMQVHNVADAQTLFAFNNWGGNANAGNVDLGIGNQAASNPDWTQSFNGGNYAVKTIQVLVQTSGDSTPPQPVAANASFGRTSIVVQFSEPLAGASVSATNFTLNGGVSVLGARLAGNQRDVVLTTTTLPTGTPLNLTVTGVRDSSPSANRLASATIAVSEPALPAEIVANVGAAASNYQLVYSIDLPATGNFNSSSAAYRVDDTAAAGMFNRVAYYLELQKPGQPAQFVWAAMDAFSAGRNRLAIPTTASGAVFQQQVTNLDVISNVDGVTTGTSLTGGNIEFWPNDYTAPNAANIPGASATAYDFGDSRTTTAGQGNYGSMQIHNHGANQTVFAINHFGIDGNALDVGIGTQPVNHPDWTFAANASSYSKRILHVLVLPGGSTPAAVAANVPEAAGYQLAATLNIPATGNLTSGAGFTNYVTDLRAGLPPFSRIAYYLELKKTTDAAPSYIWTSMDAFTTDPLKVGVPNQASGAVFQQSVTNLNVTSNVAGVVNGTGITTGNIEFWPHSYSAPNAANIPGASGTTFDFGDTRSAGFGYGSMQVHNHGASQTLFAINNWGTAANTANALCLGIGNNPAPTNGGIDWTFANNAAVYNETRVLHVFVKLGVPDSAGPAITSVKGSQSLNRLLVTFDEPLADTAAAVANFSLDGGVSILSATLRPGNREILLATSAQTPATAYTLSATGIRDRSSAGNLIAAGATASFTSAAATLPPVVANVPEAAGFKLVYQLAIPSATPRWNFNAIPYSVDESIFGEQGFDRVAYVLELDDKWVYTSFDAFTSFVSKVGVPTLNVTSTAFQQKVTNLNVASNVAGIVTGTNLTGGNIEFWGGNYSAPNALAIPNASETDFDFGDTMSAGGHGSMQVHNHEASQTLFAYNNWGSNAGQTSDTGIGNNATGTGNLDWTFSNGAALSTVRNLYVLIHPAPRVGTGPGPQLASQPLSRSVAPGGTTTLAISVNGAGPFTYQWRKNGVDIVGATNPWLDLSAFDATQAGSYDVVVTNAAGASTTSEPAVLTIAPTFGGYAFTVGEGEIGSIELADLLAKASGPAGKVLSISAVGAASQQGAEVLLQPATVRYTPAIGFLGTDTFTVTISDGDGGSVVGTVNATVTAAEVNEAGQPTLATRTGNKVDVLFHGTVGQVYQIQRSTLLQTWEVIHTASPGDDGLLPYTDLAPPVGRAFYRAKPVLP